MGDRAHAEAQNLNNFLRLSKLLENLSLELASANELTTSNELAPALHYG
jgi:hypothetical protein